VVVVDSAAEERQRARGDVLLGERRDVVHEARLVERRLDGERPAQTDALGDDVEQRVDRRNADRSEHLGDLAGGVREIAQDGRSAQEGADVCTGWQLACVLDDVGVGQQYMPERPSTGWQLRSPPQLSFCGLHELPSLPFKLAAGPHATSSAATASPDITFPNMTLLLLRYIPSARVRDSTP
jgi:hypothetical protein